MSGTLAIACRLGGNNSFPYRVVPSEAFPVNMMGATRSYPSSGREFQNGVQEPVTLQVLTTGGFIRLEAEST
jgi:hypothetical protein